MDGDSGLEGRWKLKASHITEEWSSRICPRQVATRESWEWLRLFASYRCGFLLEAGGLIDQPAIYMHAMSLIETYDNLAREK